MYQSRESDSENCCKIGVGMVCYPLILFKVNSVVYYADVEPTVCQINSAEAVFFETGSWSVRANVLELSENVTRTLREPCPDAIICETLVETEYLPVGRLIDCTLRSTSVLTPNKSAYTRYPIDWWWGDILEVVIETILLIVAIGVIVLICVAGC